MSTDYKPLAVSTLTNTLKVFRNQNVDNFDAFKRLLDNNLRCRCLLALCVVVFFVFMFLLKTERKCILCL